MSDPHVESEDAGARPVVPPSAQPKEAEDLDFEMEIFVEGKWRNVDRGARSPSTLERAREACRTWAERGTKARVVRVARSPMAEERAEGEESR